MNRGEFMREVFADPRLKIPVTTHTARAWQAENQAEGGAELWNPTNTTLAMPHSWVVNSAGVRSYATRAEGHEATVRTLLEPQYRDLVAALRSNAPARKICTLWGRSPWGTALTLMLIIRAELARTPAYLRTLEKKEIAS